MIQEAFKSGARIAEACKTIKLSLRSYRRWFKAGDVQADQRQKVVRDTPKNKLSAEERQAILDVCNEPEYASLPPSQIVPILMDKGVYLGSESSFYRTLTAFEQLNRRGQSKVPSKKSKPTSFAAAGPNEVWSWDITYLASAVKGQFYYLYLFEDIFSRKIVGYEVHESECGQLAAELVQRCMLREQCFNTRLVLHSDNGAPMKSQTMKAKLEELGVQSSYSRPRVSNDNPYSEALFKTMKYCPQWPSKGFNSLDEARDWVQCFVLWYNDEHKHSRINFVTPSQRHAGLDGDILLKREVVLEAAKAKNPNRWSGKVRNCKPAGVVMLNPDKVENIELKATG